MLLVTTWSAAAQTAPQAAAKAGLPADKVYVYVEKMPQLPGGGGMLAIVTAVQQHISYPLRALRAHAEGKVFVSFTVAASGVVENVAVTRLYGQLP